MREMDAAHHKKEDAPRSVLIVDDEQSIAEVLAYLVKDLGYTPLVAFNGQEAIALVNQDWPALIITDFMMPLMDGSELINRIRKEAEKRNLPSPPIILLTAAGTRAVQHLQVDRVISKPFDLLQLEETLLLFLHADSS